jgi:hypothetical protein
MEKQRKEKSASGAKERVEEIALMEKSILGRGWLQPREK